MGPCSLARVAGSAEMCPLDLSLHGGIACIGLFLLSSAADIYGEDATSVCGAVISGNVCFVFLTNTYVAGLCYGLVC